MIIDRRTFNGGLLATSVVLLTGVAEARSGTMYGLISQVTTRPEHRDELVRILVAATGNMPGCLGYVIALDAGRDDAVWITETWRDADSHAASLRLPQVQAAMAEGRPLITGMGFRTETRPVAGA